MPKLIYVSINGRDTPTCGAQGLACRTIQYSVVNISAANDEILVNATHEGNQAIYKESDILIEKDLAIIGIDGQPEILFNQSKKSFVITTCKVQLHYLHFREMLGVGQAIVTVNNSNVYLKNCFFHDINYPLKIFSSPYLESKLKIDETLFQHPLEGISTVRGNVYMEISSSQFVGRPNCSRFGIKTGQPFATENYVNLNCIGSQFKYFSSAISVSTAYNYLAHIVIKRSIFLHNHILQDIGNYDSGSALFFQDTGTLDILDSVFINNTSKYGGAVAVSNNVKNMQVFVHNCTFENNKAVISGGAIHFLSGKATIGNSTFSNNLCSYSLFPPDKSPIGSPDYGVGGAISFRGRFNVYGHPTDRPSAIVANCVLKHNAAEY